MRRSCVTKMQLLKRLEYSFLSYKKELTENSILSKTSLFVCYSVYLILMCFCFIVWKACTSKSFLDIAASLTADEIQQEKLVDDKRHTAMFPNNSQSSIQLSDCHFIILLFSGKIRWNLNYNCSDCKTLSLDMPCCG